MLGDKLLTRENRYDMSRSQRYRCKRSRCDIMTKMVERKQGSYKWITFYEDDLLRMGRELAETETDTGRNHQKRLLKRPTTSLRFCT